MTISDAIHALILFDQKKLISRKTRLKANSGEIFKFIRVDTQLNWPRLIVETANRDELIWNSMAVRRLDLEILENSIVIEQIDY